MSVAFACISEKPLEVSTHLMAVADATVGATALFVGTVRDHDPGADGAVQRLAYEAHPQAQEIIAKLAANIDAKFAAEGVRIAVSHRVGDLAVGEIAIIAAVASAHRQPAFTACRELVETIKHELPVWKKQYTTNGESNWVGIR